MNHRLERLILTCLTIAFIIAIAAFVVGYSDHSFGYTDVVLMMIATMTYLGGCELAFYLTEKKLERCSTVIDGQQCRWPSHSGNVHNVQGAK